MALRADGYAYADFAGAARDGVGHEAIEADGSEEQRESGKETGEHGGDAFFDKLCVNRLRSGPGAERVFVAKRIDRVGYRFRKRLARRLLSAHYEAAPVRWSIEARKEKKNRGGRIANIEDPSIADDAHDFEVFGG